MKTQPTGFDRLADVVTDLTDADWQQIYAATRERYLHVHHADEDTPSNRVVHESDVFNMLMDISDARNRARGKPPTFQTQYLGTPSPGLPSELIALAQQYHDRTEQYDRTVCTGPIVNGSIMPNDGREYVLASKHAVAVRRTLCSEAERLGFTVDQWWGAVEQVRSEMARKHDHTR